MSKPRFITRRRVEFADTDLGGIVHFSRFFVFMETAEHEFLRSLGYEVHFDLDGRTVGWPRVDASCTYRKPARFADVLDIELRIERRGGRSMTYGIRFLRDRELIAEGKVSSVCCILDDPAGLKAIDIPPELAKRLLP